MSKIKEAKEILKQMGFPLSQQNEMSALTLLALCNLKKNDSWVDVSKISLGVSNGIMSFAKEHYKIRYAPNTRETFRRNVLHQFVQGGLAVYNPDNPNLPVNSPKAHYSISNEALNLLKYFNSQKWDEKLTEYLKNKGTLIKKYEKERYFKKIPLTISGKKIFLSPGKHNVLQKDILTEFAPRFIKQGVLLYIGDTEEKNLYINAELLSKFNIPIDKHSKLPDVVIYDKSNAWLFLIEAVTSHGPMSPKRIIEIEKLLKKCKLGKVFVTAFPDFKTFTKYSRNLAWETEVWLAEAKDHMIHFNGDKFFGPR